jgi:hypothetical protein
MVNFSKSFSLLIILILALFSLIVVSAPNVKADLYLNGYHFAYKPYISYPLNDTYDSRLLSLNVSFHALLHNGVNYSMTYSLDGQEKVEVPLVQHYIGVFDSQEKSYIDGSLLLPAMPDGAHNIRVILSGSEEVPDLVPPFNFHYYASDDTDTVYFNTHGFTPTPTPTVPELSWLVIVPLLLSVFSVAVIFRRRKTAKLS